MKSKDPYSDVSVHETAHLLHYLKPRRYRLHTHRGQERFVDVEFRRRELFAFACEAYSRVVLHGGRKSRIAFAESCTTAPSHSHGANEKKWLHSFSVLPVHAMAGV